MKLKDACSLEEKLCQPRQHIYNQRHCFAEKVCLVKVMVFPVVMYGCECWTIKKAEHQRTDVFELWCWRRLLIVPWTTRISPEYSLEGQMLKLKLQYFSHLMWTVDSLEKTLMLGKIEGGRRRGWQRIRWLMAAPSQWTWVWASSRRWWRTGKPGILQSLGSQGVGHDWVTDQHQQSLRLYHV